MAQIQAASSPLHLNDLLALLPWVPTGPICELGSGQGHLSAAMAAYGFAVTALDVDKNQIQCAQQAYGEQVTWLCSDLRSYRLQRETYAALICLNVFPFIPNGERARLIGRLKAAVRPGGWLVLSGLLAEDAAAQEKWARSSNQISCLPTGVFGKDELPERLSDWEIHFFFYGPAFLRLQQERRQHQVVQIIARKPQTAQRAIRWNHLPLLGLGQALNWPQQAASQSDFVQWPAEALLDPHQDHGLLHRIKHRPRITFQAEGLSLISAAWRPELYLTALSRLLQRCESPWWVTPLGYLRTEQRETPLLQPVPLTEEALELSKQNIRTLSKQIAQPVLLSLRPSWQFSHADMAYTTFVRHLALEADCGLSLHLPTFLHMAAQDWESWLERLPLERVIQVELAGLQPDQLEVALNCLKLLITAAQLRAVLITPLEAAMPTLQQVLKSWRPEPL